MKDMKVRLKFTDTILGTKPADPEIHSHFVASKAPDAKTIAQELAAHEISVEDVEERGKTIFYKMEDGTPYIEHYQVKGFFKSTCKALQQVPGTESGKKNTKGTFYKFASYKSKIDQLIFVSPDIIPLWMPINLDLTATDCQRPLRASTPQGERIALAHSEEAPTGTTVEFTVTCLVDDHMKLVREWLDYGKFSGLCQWRNAGHGRFEWEEIG